MINVHPVACAIINEKISVFPFAPEHTFLIEEWTTLENTKETFCVILFTLQMKYYKKGIRNF